MTEKSDKKRFAVFAAGLTVLFSGALSAFQSESLSYDGEVSAATLSSGESVLTLTSGGTLRVTDTLNARVLLVGGGGAGGGGAGGGGGGGQVVESEFLLLPGDYAIAIGAGGDYVHTDNWTNQGANGGGTTAFGLVALGGGGGGSWGAKFGSSGANGGGGSNKSLGGSAVAPGGFDGGAGGNYGGGGAGAGGPGEAGTNSAAGRGGDGAPSDITGETVYYGAGGGGGDYNYSTSAGSGGLAGLGALTGGCGGNPPEGYSIAAAAGAYGCGGGGGGGDCAEGGGQQQRGGAGASGVVILRCSRLSSAVSLAVPTVTPHYDGRWTFAASVLAVRSASFPVTVAFQVKASSDSDWTLLDGTFDSVMEVGRTPFSLTADSPVAVGATFSVRARAVDADGIVYVSEPTDITVPTGSTDIMADGQTIQLTLGNEKVLILPASQSVTVTQDAVVRVLLVGGGGAGGGGAAGGGGGGQVVESDLYLSAGTYRVSIGAGGDYVHTSDWSNPGANGGRTTAFGLVALGGGGGGSWRAASGLSGANGGGGSNKALGGSAVVPSGFDGGAGGNYGGGGAGAGGPGEAGTNSAAGRGGDGAPSDITGETVYYGAGGGGGDYNHSTSAGSGGLAGLGALTGGCGGNPPEGYSIAAAAGAYGCGGGGGGGDCAEGGGQQQRGGAGASGVVIIRFVFKAASAREPVGRLVAAEDVTACSAVIRAEVTALGEGSDFVDVRTIHGFAPDALIYTNAAVRVSDVTDSLAVPCGGLLPDKANFVAVVLRGANGEETVSPAIEIRTPAEADGATCPLAVTGWAYASGVLSATLAVGPSETGGELRLLFGETYGGDTPAAWEHTVKVADLAAASEAVSVPVSWTIGTAPLYVRFAVIDANGAVTGLSQTILPALGEILQVANMVRLDAVDGDAVTVVATLVGTFSGAISATVRYGTQPNNLAETVEATVANGEVRGRIMNLTPDTPYYAQVTVVSGAQSDVTDVLSFRTAGASVIAYKGITCDRLTHTATITGELTRKGAGETTVYLDLGKGRTAGEAAANRSLVASAVLREEGPFAFSCPIAYSNYVVHAVICSNTCVGVSFGSRHEGAGFWYVDDAVYRFTGQDKAVWESAASWTAMSGANPVGYPAFKTKGVFPAGETQCVRVTSDLRFGGIEVGAGADVTVLTGDKVFFPADNGSGYKVGAGATLRVVGEGRQNERVDGLGLDWCASDSANTAVNLSADGCRLVLAGQSVRLSANLNLGSDGGRAPAVIELENGSELFCRWFYMKGYDGLLSLDDSTFTGGFCGAWGSTEETGVRTNTFRFAGASPRFMHTNDSPECDRPTVLDHVFEIPSDGFAAAPIQRVAGNASGYFTAAPTTGTHEIRFRVAKESPALKGGRRFDAVLFDWSLNRNDKAALAANYTVLRDRADDPVFLDTALADAAVWEDHTLAAPGHARDGQTVKIVRCDDPAAPKGATVFFEIEPNDGNPIVRRVWARIDRRSPLVLIVR